MTSKAQVGTAHIEAYLHDADITAVQLAGQLGLGHSTLSGWLGQRHAPAWTTYAIQGLRAEMNIDDDAAGKCLVIVQCNSVESKAINALAVALGAHATEFGLAERRSSTP